MNNEKDILAGRINTSMTFNEKVWALTARVPKGRVTTYAEIAHALGTMAYRAVGNALNKTPYKSIPCHRVVGSNHKLGGYASKLANKIKLLKAEGIDVRNGRVSADDIFPLDLRTKP